MNYLVNSLQGRCERWQEINGKTDEHQLERSSTTEDI